jgi:N-acetylmuramic acid 6-phosphate etherase
MVTEIASVDEGMAAQLLETAAGSVKVAVLLASGAPDADAARAALARSGDALRPALAEFDKTQEFHKRA